MRIGTKAFGGAQSFLKSSLESRKYKEAFENIRSYCMFVGYPMSGHSLIGSFLDAHPNMVVAHELDALAYLGAGFNRNQLFYLLLEKSKEFTQSGRKWMGYSYAVPNQWHGKFKELRVIGDKKGGRSTIRIGSKPELVQRLREVVSVNIKFVHITRNPFDNISTISKKQGEVYWDKFDKPSKTLQDAIEYYFYLCEINKRLKAEIPTDDFFECKYEAFISEPRNYLAELCRFLGEEAPADYLDDCIGTIFKSPHKSRQDIQWDPESTSKVEARIKEFDFLQDYTFES